MNEVRGIRNNNPLNIRKGCNWMGERQDQQDPVFEEFISLEYGIRAALKLMINHITGFGGTRRKANTLQKLIWVWAPPSENNSAAYVRTVASACDMSPNSLLDPKNEKQICAVCRAMAKMESGVWLDESLFHSAWALK